MDQGYPNVLHQMQSAGMTIEFDHEAASEHNLSTGKTSEREAIKNYLLPRLGSN